MVTSAGSLMTKTTKHQNRRIDLEEARRLSHKCAEGELSNPLWEKYDATDWHSEAAEDLGLDYDAAGAHIAYWFAWLVEHDLESGFVCTDSDDLIRDYVTSLNRIKDGEPDAINAMLSEAEELHGTMLSDAGNRFTKANYEQPARLRGPIGTAVRRVLQSKLRARSGDARGEVRSAIATPD
jgi:hypothetical protein